MTIQQVLQRERQVWHKHFVPSLLAGALVALVSVLYESHFADAVLLGSIGASAVILTHATSHHLTTLHTIVLAYIAMMALSWLIVFISDVFMLSLSTETFLTVFLVSIGLYAVDAFHPPAISAATALITSGAPFSMLPLHIFAVLLVAFIGVRFVTYVARQQLSVREFGAEFKRHFV